MSQSTGVGTDWLSIYLSYEPSIGPLTIGVERLHGPVLLISGQMDRPWPSERLADIAFQRLQAQAFTHCYEHLRYAGWLHS